MIVKGQVDVSKVKRCYVDSQIRLPCGVCGGTVTRDFSSDYISYPEIGIPITIGVYCEKCDVYYDVPAKILNVEMTIEIYNEGTNE